MRQGNAGGQELFLVLGGQGDQRSAAACVSAFVLALLLVWCKLLLHVSCICYTVKAVMYIAGLVHGIELT